MRVHFVVFLAVMVTCCGLSSAGQSCERITHQICQGLGYNYTLFPNRFNHINQNQASLAMHQFHPFLKNRCSSSLRMFLCSMYVPACSKTPLPPCRSLCNRAKSGCGSIMATFGMSWPKSFECSNLPEFGNQLCITSSDGEKAPKIPDSPLSTTAATTTTTTTTSPITSPTTTSQATTPRSGCTEKITIPMCRGIGYNYTRMPNIFSHDNQDEAALEVHQYWPLVKTDCSSSFRKFLCSVYAPRCTQTGGAMLPCRSLCEESKRGCEPMMKNFGFAWPTKFNCKTFPMEGGDTSCIAPDPQPGRVCEKITLSMCNGIGYNYTSMPNPLHHKTQAEAGLEVLQYWPLVKAGCSSSIRKFLCSVYAPRCTQTGGIMLPCRSLCEESKRGCEPMMKNFGFAWSTSLNCSSFPVEGGDTSCIAPDSKPGRKQAARTSKCEKITIPMCKGLPYNTTMYPNLLQHRYQEEAGLEIHQYYPLIAINCSSSLRLFLCTVYAPRCSDFIIPPCRSLCERARGGCLNILKRLGFSWPAHLNCSLFPVEGSSECIPPSEMTTTTMPTTVAAFTFGPKIYRALLTKIKGTFNSPNYPNPYPKRIEVNWVIKLPETYKAVKITIKTMRLEEDRNCLYDYILIKDKMLNQVGPRHCGTYRNPYGVLVRGNKVTVNFVSDDSTTKEGFVISYRGLQNLP